MSANRRPTMRDVAAQAGVSFKTVSRVINDEGGVSDALVRRVRKAVADLGYRPDQRARNLRQSTSEATTIGFVLVDVANPFFGSILRGIEEVATERGCLVLAGSTEGSRKREQQLVDTFVERRVAGLIVISSGAAEATLKAELKRGTPVVFVDLEPDPGSGLEQVDLVRSDHMAGAVAATEHLIAHGHRTIAYFGDDPRIFSARLRLDGYRRAMADAGLDIDESMIVVGSHTQDDWEEIIASFLEDSHSPPSAIFTAQNYVTVGAVRALHRLGLRQTMAHVGFDDVDMADVVSPGISVVPQNPRELGRQAAELLFARLDGDTTPPRAQVMASPLIQRGSGEIEHGYHRASTCP